MCAAQKKKKKKRGRKKEFFLHLLLLLFLPYLSLSTSWNLPMQLDLVSVCVPGLSQPSLSPLLHSTPLSHFTAPLGSSLHSNRTIMQPVWSTTTTLHDSATTIELLQQAHCRLCIEPLLLLLLLLLCVCVDYSTSVYIRARAM